MNKDIEQVGFEEKYFDTGEVKLHYLVGPNNGPPLVLVPAQGLSLESYQRYLCRYQEIFKYSPLMFGVIENLVGQQAIIIFQTWERILKNY